MQRNLLMEAELDTSLGQRWAARVRCDDLPKVDGRRICGDLEALAYAAGRRGRQRSAVLEVFARLPGPITERM
jgi:hypothetical protein